MRLIDADNFLERFEKMCETETDNVIAAILRGVLIKEPIAYDVGAVVEKLKERTDFLKDYTKYGNKNAKQQSESYSTMMMYEVADLVDDLIEIVKAGVKNE